MMKHLFFFVICFLVFSSCVSKKHSAHLAKFIRLGENAQKDTVGVVERQTLILARELCREGEYNFCWDGTDTPIRNSELFIHIDTNTMELSYNSGVYGFFFTSVIPELNRRKIHWESPFQQHLLFLRYDSSANAISIPLPKRFKRPIQRELNRSGIPLYFDGTLKYVLYEIDFEYIYVGKRDILGPNLDGKYESFSSSMFCDAYQILKVYSVFPYDS